jgi:hypothetical protein
MSLELYQILKALSLFPDHLQSPLTSPLMPEAVLVALPTDQSLSTSESLGKHTSPLEFASTVNLMPSSPSESSLKLYTIIPLPALPLEVSDAMAIPSHLSSQEQMIGVDAMHAVTSTTVLPANAQLVLLSSSFIDRLHTSPSPLLTISSSRFHCQSSRSENIPVHPTPPLETSLNVPTSPYLTLSQLLQKVLDSVVMTTWAKSKISYGLIQIVVLGC